MPRQSLPLQMEPLVQRTVSANDETAGQPEPRRIEFAVPDISDDEVDAVCRVLRSGWLTTGEECAAFERELEAFVGGGCHVVALSSGTAALETAFAYLDLPGGSRVGVPAWTFVSSALAPMKHGLRPVLLDVDEETLNVDVASLHAALEEGLDAVVPVHFGGVAVDERVHQLCAEYAVPVVEDCAHALGATDQRGPMAARGSVAGCFSFYATKNLTTAEGGALVTEDAALADFAWSYRLHGLSRDAWVRNRADGPSSYDLEMPGIKANLPDLLAALGRVQLARFPELQRRRGVLAARYRERLAGVAGLRCVPSSEAPEGTAHHLMAVILPDHADRQTVRQKLTRAGVASSVHFPPLNEFSLFHQHAEFGPTGVPTASALGGRALTLPFHPGLADADVDTVCAVLRDSLT
jgi:dTDP-4-amino-4,6-dideoxygalactose transaminase